MEIPNALKGLTVEKCEFINVLLQDESKGVIVARVAFLDFLIGEVLAVYFCGLSRRPDFLESVVSQLSFDGKIRTLTELSLDGQAASLRDQVIGAIRPMQKLRNVAAHAAALRTPEVEKLYSDPAKRQLLANFPRAFEQAGADIQNWLQQLERSPGFEVGTKKEGDR
jgi:hypothetical protein